MKQQSAINQTRQSSNRNANSNINSVLSSTRSGSTIADDWVGSQVAIDGGGEVEGCGQELRRAATGLGRLRYGLDEVGAGFVMADKGWPGWSV